ncbi:IMPACT family protein [Spongiimicrobium sp. 3-5]|uniref:IMPACT family protein n=1 Tax=Spongiimicrobium sp. 3-5 TaxID=3332596 RepID=UPI00397EF549
MENGTDTYKTLLAPSSEVILKERKSKFYAYAFPLTSEDQVKEIINTLRKKHYTANHVCYAWQLGVENPRYRANDDGEPNNSAGMPIYGQIQAYGLTNVLIAVVRIFGGVKLGIGGLISAYRGSAKMAIEASDIVTLTLKVAIRITFEYALMDKVMRIIKQYGLEIATQQLEVRCDYSLLVRKQMAPKIIEIFNQTLGVTLHASN